MNARLAERTGRQSPAARTGPGGAGCSRFRDRLGGFAFPSLIAVIALSATLAAPARGADCRRLGQDVLPRLGGLRDAWLGPDEFVLTDRKRRRLLVYDIHAGTAKPVLVPSSGSWIPGELPDESEPARLAPFGDGALLAVDRPFSPPASADREVLEKWRETLDSLPTAYLVLLDDRLSPVETVPWPVSVGSAPGAGERYVDSVREISISGDRMLLWAMRQGRVALLGLGIDTIDGATVPQSHLGLTEQAAWTASDVEGLFLRSFPVTTLAGPRGPAGNTYVLRLAQQPFIQGDRL